MTDTPDPRLVRLRLQFAIAAAQAAPQSHASDVAIRATYLAEAFLKANPTALDALEPEALAEAPSPRAQAYLDRAREIVAGPPGALNLRERNLLQRVLDGAARGARPWTHPEAVLGEHLRVRGLLTVEEREGQTVYLITDAGRRALGAS